MTGHVSLQNQKPLRILIVEDDFSVSDVLSEMIRALHPATEIDVADTLKSAQEKLSLGKFDLIWMDGQFPGQKNSPVIHEAGLILADWCVAQRIEGQKVFGSGDSFLVRQAKEKSIFLSCFTKPFGINEVSTILSQIQQRSVPHRPAVSGHAPTVHQPYLGYPAVSF